MYYSFLDYVATTDTTNATHVIGGEPGNQFKVVSVVTVALGHSLIGKWYVTSAFIVGSDGKV